MSAAQISLVSGKIGLGNTVLLYVALLCESRGSKEAFTLDELLVFLENIVKHYFLLVN